MNRPADHAGVGTAPPVGDAPALWTFSGIRFDERRMEVQNGDQVVALPRRAFDLLRHLMRSPGEVLGKDELIDQVWAERAVGDGVLARTVAQLRRALGDSEQELLRTVHGIGIRFQPKDLRREVAECGPVASSERAAGEAITGRPRWHLDLRLTPSGSADVWRIRNHASEELRVIKLANDEAGLAALKREITLSRMFRQSLGSAAPTVPVLDWNLQRRPYWVELPYLMDGSLRDWWTSVQGHWTLTERIDLAAQIAAALAYAHGLGVLHKDLKPANILIDRDAEGKAIPRLADFGSAHLLDEGSLERLGITRLGFTQTGKGLDSSGGTPLYLAPELVRGAPFTLASDIYALGVILYQLVIDDPDQPIATGWERGVSDEMLREDIARLVDGDPARRQSDAATLARRLRTLDARRAERALSANLRADAERALRLAEQARRRRNRIALVAGVLLVVSMAMGSLYLRAQSALTLAEAQRQRADRQAEQANGISDFLTWDVIGFTDPWISGRDQNEISIREAMDHARTRIATRFGDLPNVEAAVRLRVALALPHMDDSDGALAELELALPLAEDTLTRSEILVTAVDAYIRKGAWEQGIQAARAYLATEDRTDPSRTLLARARIAGAEHSLGNLRTAESQFRAVLADALPRIGNQRVTTAFTMAPLAMLLADLGEFEEALALQREVTERHIETYGRENLLTLSQLRRLGSILTRIEQFEEADLLLLESHQRTHEKLGPDHSVSLEGVRELGLLRLAQGRPGEALELLGENSRGLLRLFGDANYRSRDAQLHLGRAQLAAGQLPKAISTLRAAHRAYRDSDGPDHPGSLKAATALAQALRQGGQVDESAALLQVTLHAGQQRYPNEWFVTAELVLALAEHRRELGDAVQAQALLAHVQPHLLQSLGPPHSLSRRALALAAVDWAAE